MQKLASKSKESKPIENTIMRQIQNRDSKTSLERDLKLLMSFKGPSMLTNRAV